MSLSRHFVSLVAFASLLLLSAGASAQDRPFAIVGATIYTVSGPPIRGGTILVEAGKIKAIGSKVVLPNGTRKVDGRGKFIIPGLIDTRSALFLDADEVNTAGAPDRHVLDGVDSFDDNAARVLSHGVTTVYISPGRRGSVTGIGSVVKLQPKGAVSTDVDTSSSTFRTLRKDAALNATLGVSSTNRTSTLERLASYEALRSLFKSAQQYVASLERFDRALKRYEAEQKAGNSGAGEDPGDPFGEEDPFGGFGQQPGGAGQKPVKPRAVPAQEALAKALRREIPVRIEAHREDDILNALRLADEFKLKLVLERATECPKAASELVSRNVPVVWGPTLIPGVPQIDTMNHRPEAARLLEKAGVKFAIATAGEGGLASRFVLENAAAAAGHGLSRDRALRAVTKDAAELLGVSERVGSLQVGKDADFVLLDGPIWEAATRVVQVWVDGKAVKNGR